MAAPRAWRRIETGALVREQAVPAMGPARFLDDLPGTPAPLARARGLALRYLVSADDVRTLASAVLPALRGGLGRRRPPARAWEGTRPRAAAGRAPGGDRPKLLSRSLVRPAAPNAIRSGDDRPGCSPGSDLHGRGPILRRHQRITRGTWRRRRRRGGLDSPARGDRAGGGSRRHREPQPARLRSPVPRPTRASRRRAACARAHRTARTSPAGRSPGCRHGRRGGAAPRPSRRARPGIDTMDAGCVMVSRPANCAGTDSGGRTAFRSRPIASTFAAT